MELAVSDLGPCTDLHDEHGLVGEVSDHVVVELDHGAALALPENALDCPGYKTFSAEAVRPTKFSRTIYKTRHTALWHNIVC
jgi:hypothetical protein